MSGVGAVPQPRFANPLPHTPLNHYLKQTKALLASGALDNEDAVYVLTSSRPTLDQIVAAIGLAYAHHSVAVQSHTQYRYVPVVSASRKSCLEQHCPELALALQTSLLSPENIIFEDDAEYTVVNAYTSKKKAILVGSNPVEPRLSSLQQWNDWQDLHGLQLFGVVDVENTLPTELHQEDSSDINNRLHLTILPPTISGSAAARASLESTDPEPSLTSLVALWAKAQIQERTKDASERLQLTTQTVTSEVADLFLSAVLLETNNLAESQTNPADLGAVGWLNPLSSFQVQNLDQATAPTDAPDDTANDDENEDELNVPSYDPYVPTFPDLDALFRALKAASGYNNGSGAAEQVAASGSKAATSAASVPVSPPTHFEWNLITNTFANPRRTDEQRASFPAYVRQTIEGDFAELLNTPTALALLKPIASMLGTALGSGASTLDLITASVQTSVTNAVTDNLANEEEMLCIAVAALHAFVQINWTGPELPDSLDTYTLLRKASPDAFPPRSLEDEEAKEQQQAKKANSLVHTAALDALAFKGEPAYHLCQVPFYLVFARLVFEAMWTIQQQQQQQQETASSKPKINLETLAWWRLRVYTVHSHVLDEPVAFGKKVFEPVSKLRDVLQSRASAPLTVAAADSGSDSGKKDAKTGRNEWASLAARLILERGIALQRLGSDREASETFVEAAKQNGLRYRMSGALGKRTKFQTEDKTQLVLLAKSVVADGGKEDEQADESANSSSRQAQEDGQEPSVTTGGDTAVSTEDGQKAKDQPIETGFAAKANPEDQVKGMPSTFALNDDVLLEQTKFTSVSGGGGGGSSSSSDGDGEDTDLLSLDPNSQPALAVLDQCVLLALCLNVRNSQAAHGLTANQMSMFVSRVIVHPQNWMVHTMSLLLRARLEATRTRTVERSVLQLQALIDQMPTNDSSVQERLKFFHALDLPPKWECQAELARRYASIGVTRSALEIFQRLEMYEDVVQCLGMLGRQEEGIEVVRELLEGKKVEADVDVSTRRRKTAAASGASSTSEALGVMYTRLDRARESKLWCLLGDLEPERALEHYTEAWRVSQSSSARAARSLGGVHFTAQRWKDAAKWLREGLRINPLYTRSWFVLGCCLMRLEAWGDAAQAFRRCTSLDDEDAESWNNLASCYLRMVNEVAGAQAPGTGTGTAISSNLQAILEAENEADELWDEYTHAPDGDNDEESDIESLSDWSGSSRSDSGVELSGSDTETERGDQSEDEEAAASGGLRNPGSVSRSSTSRRQAVTPYSLKLLAHRSLKQSLRFAHENWRVWYNYMIVSVDVGYLLEATRAMVRVVEIQTKSVSNDRDRAALVDFDVLARLVAAVTATPKAQLERQALEQVELHEARVRLQQQEQEQGREAPPGSTHAKPQPPALDPNSGLGLAPAVKGLFEGTLLERISTSSRIWRLYASLLMWEGDIRKAVQTALLNGYNSSLNAGLNPASRDEDILSNHDVFTATWNELKSLVHNLVELPQIALTDADPNPKFQARNLVRSFIAKTREAWQDSEQLEEAKELLAGLRS
ncbi:TPR-like protein [Testicularia cyperi]|uniref:TPR-like protein n=1 Tax=Testicularia cyperi TaxID=1882483 RepID=A0A317XIP0_9BASI|nr:TPR-like protein [Testicularia cyperi]